MKKLLVPALIVAVLMVFLASCASSRQYGCPNNTQSNYRFRG